MCFCRLSLNMSEPQFVVELCQTEAIPGTSSNTKGKAAESAIDSAEEDVDHECEYNDYPSSESTGSGSIQDHWAQGPGRGRGQGQERRDKKRARGRGPFGGVDGRQQPCGRDVRQGESGAAEHAGVL